MKSKNRDRCFPGQHVYENRKCVKCGHITKSNSTYVQRNILIRKLGFSDYAEYLQSDLWKKIRARCFGRFRMKCNLCGGQATEVHHIKYTHANLSGESIQHLVAVCRSCHEGVEFRDGEKQNMQGAQNAYYVKFSRYMASIQPRGSKVCPVCQGKWPLRKKECPTCKKAEIKAKNEAKREAKRKASP